MKLVIFGASGGVGSELFRQALEAGHQVTAFVRHAEEIMLEDKNLKVVVGDALRAEEVEPAVAGQDALISALGSGYFAKKRLEAPATRHMLQAMHRHKVKRIAVISAYNVDPKLQHWLTVKLANATVLKVVAPDKRETEQLLRQSGVEWTVVRPLLLTNGRRTSDYFIDDYDNLHFYSHISRGNVADFMLQAVTNQQYQHRSVLLHE